MQQQVEHEVNLKGKAIRLMKRNGRIIKFNLQIIIFTLIFQLITCEIYIISTNYFKQQSIDMNQSQYITKSSVRSINSNPSTLALYSHIKKKPYTQEINGINYTYSILNKKQKSFVMSNERFLCLIGIDSISYARSIPHNQPLPITNIAQIPKFKATFPISEIQNYTNQQQKLIIKFSGNRKTTWEFICPSKVCALQWRKTLDKATNLLIQFNQSGFKTLQQFENHRQLLLTEQNQSASRSLTNYYAESVSNNSLQQSNISYLQNQLPKLEQPSPQKINFQKEITRGKVEQQNRNPKINGINDKNHKNDKKQDKNIRLQMNQSLKQNDSKLRHNQKFNKFIDRNNQDRQILSRSIESIPISQKQQIIKQIAQLRRNWIQQLAKGQNLAELILSFKQYGQKIVEIVVNQLYIPIESKIYPPSQQSKYHISYEINDILLQVYLINQEHLYSKNIKYQLSLKQFKNLDYFIGQTSNQEIVKAPLMMMFQYKGFQGMIRTKLTKKTQILNRQAYQLINKQQFLYKTKILPQLLLQQSNCQILAYHHSNFIKENYKNHKIYFLQKLQNFLPADQCNPTDRNKQVILRAELVQNLNNDLLQNYQRYNDFNIVNSAIEAKVQQLLIILETMEDYFTNSKELSDLMHFHGLNIRYLGKMYAQCRRIWLKKILQAELIARSAKNYFRLDIQNSILDNLSKLSKKQRQNQRQKNRVISFLNVMFGNTQATFKLWRNFNKSSEQQFHIKIWQDYYTDININYLLQAIQINFKIELSQNIYNKTIFQNMNTFLPQDFVRFRIDTQIYNLQFTDIFQDIYQCLQNKDMNSFQQLCQILTEQSESGVTYFQLLQNHPIHDEIAEYLLDFTPPEENQQLFTKLQKRNLPNRLLYQSKLSQMRWYLKDKRQDKALEIYQFIRNRASRQLGYYHPIFNQINWIFAIYYCDQNPIYQNCIYYAENMLQIQKQLLGQQHQNIWKCYLFIGKVHYINKQHSKALSNLFQAKKIVKLQKQINFQDYGTLCFLLSNSLLFFRRVSQAYMIAIELYNLLKNERDQYSISCLIDAVNLIKLILQQNQEDQRYYKFIQSDFSAILPIFLNSNLINAAISIAFLPCIVWVINKNQYIKPMIAQLMHIFQNPRSCLDFLSFKIRQGLLHKILFENLREINEIFNQIINKNMIQRWSSFNKMANQEILDKIKYSQINREFEFLAYLTAIFNLLQIHELNQLYELV